MLSQIRGLTKITVRRFWGKYGAGYLFVLPTVVLYLIFMVYPFCYTFYLSFTDWNGASPIKNFVGLANYARFFRDRLVWISLQHNLIWMTAGTVVPITLGLFLAMLLWGRPKGFLTFRTVYFLPQVLGAGILGVMWRLIYQPRRGVLFQIGQVLGIEAFRYSPIAYAHTALPAVMVAAIWASTGFFFVIMLAGLQNVDMDLMDAAQVDGADAWQRFRNVVIPQLSHVITLVTALALIGGIKEFGLIWAVTQGGPGNATEMIATHAYTEFSRHSDVGYASALTMLIAAIAFVFTMIFILVREREMEV